MRRKLFKVIAESKVVNNLIYGLKIAFVVRFLFLSFCHIRGRDAGRRGGGERHERMGGEARGGGRVTKWIYSLTSILIDCNSS